MIQNNPQEDFKEDKNFEKRNSLIGTAEISLGCAAVYGAIQGIDSYEAASPSDALGSVSFGESEIFVTPTDLGFSLLAAVGAVVVLHGALRVNRSR